MLPLPNLTHIAFLNILLYCHICRNYRRRCSSYPCIPVSLRQVTRHPLCVLCCPTFHSRRLMRTPLSCMVRTVRTALEHKALPTRRWLRGRRGHQGGKAIMVSIWWVTRALRTATPPTPAVTHTTRRIHVTPSQGRPYSRAAEAASCAGKEGESEESRGEKGGGGERGEER